MIRPEMAITPSITKTEKKTTTKKSERNVKDRAITRQYNTKNLIISRTSKDKRRLLEKRRKTSEIKNQKLSN